MKILVVDDDQAVRESLRRSLTFNGYEVELAGDGVEAIERVDRNRPDAVILDVMMPRRDGLEVCRILRSRGDDLPVLMLTARDAVWMATREGARALGMSDEIGSIEPGKQADLILVDRDRPHMCPDADPWSTLAYSATGSDVRLTMVGGQILYQDFAHTLLDRAYIVAVARSAAAELAARVGI